MVTGHAVAKVSSFAFVLIVTRGLDTVSYGYFNFAVSFVPLFLIIGAWGLDIAIMRDVGRDRSRLSELVSSALVVRVAFAIVAAALSVAVGALFTTTATAFATLALVAVALVLDEVTNLIGSVFKAFERMALFSLALLANRVITTVLALVVVVAGGDIVLVSVTYVVGSFGAAAVATLVLWTRFPPIHLRDANRSSVVALLHHGAPLGIAAALNMALFRVDTAILQAMKGAEEVGIYGIAFRFLDSFLFVAFALGAVAMPRIARETWTRDAERSFNGALVLMLVFYVPLAVGGLFLARWAVVLLFSERYAEAATAVRWLASTGVFYAIAYLCRFSAAAMGRRRQIVATAATVLTFNVVLNIALIPSLGFEGAAIATFASEVVEAIVLAAVVVRAAGRRPHLHRLVAAPLVAGAAMALALLAYGREDAVAAFMGALVYAIVLAVTARIIAFDETRRLVGSFRRR